MRNHTVFVTICALFLAGCSSAPSSESNKFSDTHPQGIGPADLLMSDNFVSENISSLRKFDVRRDVDLLAYALKRAYAGREFIVPPIFNSALNSLSQLPEQLAYPISSSALLEKIDKILMALPDNHLQAQSPTGRSQARRKADRRGSVGKSAATTQDKSWAFGEISTSRGMIGVLSIAHLADAEDPSWNGFQRSVETWLSRPFAILDLRGNGGGSDKMGYWLAARVAGKRILPPFECRMTSRTPETLALSVNNLKFQMAMRRRLKEEIPDYMGDQLSHRLKEFDESLKSMPDGFDRKTFGQIDDAGGFPPFSGRLFILTDAGCASSCEGIVKVFEQVPGVVTVGENTGGYFEFGNLGMLFLPNSRINVQIGTSYFRLRDNSKVERIGIPPMVRLNQGQDALSYVAESLIH